ncbi:uncharacterized protein B0T23DRAFT_74331 [Neurospora hispaniola]|uniref:Uncharacterized protein n=1 Tax=Neurospora hispaniola TaxID=588809 RepID=A0AAJ0IC93_9PEZI|nr:hypothetical protein B0T23DRAFT_74331 [Neurospora hispaniola]
MSSIVASKLHLILERRNVGVARCLGLDVKEVANPTGEKSLTSSWVGDDQRIPSVVCPSFLFFLFFYFFKVRCNLALYLSLFHLLILTVFCFLVPVVEPGAVEWIMWVMRSGFLVRFYLEIQVPLHT